jgi:hypothetical protein
MVTGRPVIHVDARSGRRGTHQGRGSHRRRATTPRHAGRGCAFRSQHPAAARQCYDPYHSAGLIAGQDASSYLRLERAVGFIKGRHVAYVNYELRAGGRLAASYGFPIGDGPLFLKLRRRGAVFWAGYSRDGRRWSALRRIDADFAESVEVGAAAVNSSDRTLTAELEMLDIGKRPVLPEGSAGATTAHGRADVSSPALG